MAAFSLPGDFRAVLVVATLGLALIAPRIFAKEAIPGADYCPGTLRPVSVWDYAPQPEVAAQTIRVVWDARTECLVFHSRDTVSDYTLVTRDLVLEGGTAVVVGKFTFRSFSDSAGGTPAPKPKPKAPVTDADGSRGEEGDVGTPGRDSGQVMLRFGPLLGDGRLRVLARGEAGGPGGKGADGGDGGQGNKGARRECNSTRTSCRVDATGGTGGAGGNGANGGAGGKGGNAGSIYIADELRSSASRVLELDTSGGAGGVGGKGGNAGIGGAGGPGGDGKSCGVKHCHRGAQGPAGPNGKRGNEGNPGDSGKPGLLIPLEADAVLER